jgi:hypothetical protein
MAVWVVVPYRPQPECDRAAQWARLREHLAVHGAKRAVVVEQRCDRRRFNRGALLNHGALCALRLGARAVVFHDVDLLPALAGAGHYRDPDLYTGGAVHLAARFRRYQGGRYFGGIVGLSARDLVRTNGYPSQIWGWGGEDDAQRRRCEAAGVAVSAHPVAVADLEALDDVEAKLKQLRAAGAKCPDKRERVEADNWTWHRDGINTTEWHGVRSALIYASGDLMVVRLWASPTH